ncbi:hypothetical protein FACS1894121_1620 [Bacteroidia bacterium]|nr:hypothetical protein FACS1894121_1620 [Bacteroidia bacterium]
MATIVSSSDFRTRLDTMFDLADAGERIVIKRGYNQLYRLAPIESAAVEEVEEVEDDDDPDQTDEEVEAYFTPAMRAKIDRAREQARQGMVTRVSTAEELQIFLDSL